MSDKPLRKTEAAHTLLALPEAEASLLLLRLSGRVVPDSLHLLISRLQSPSAVILEPPK